MLDGMTNTVPSKIEDNTMNNTMKWILATDIENSEAKDAIVSLIEQGYVKNVKNFNPKRKITRGEFIKILFQVV